MKTQWIPEIGEYFLAATEYGFSPVHTCTKRSKVKDQVFIIDENEVRHRLDDCEPLHDDRLLNESEMEIMLAYVEDAITEMSPKFLDDTLGQLSSQHKQQVWAALSDEQKRSLALIRQMHGKQNEESAA